MSPTTITQPYQRCYAVGAAPFGVATFFAAFCAARNRRAVTCAFAGTSISKSCGVRRSIAALAGLRSEPNIEQVSPLRSRSDQPPRPGPRQRSTRAGHAGNSSSRRFGTLRAVSLANICNADQCGSAIAVAPSAKATSPLSVSTNSDAKTSVGV